MPRSGDLTFNELISRLETVVKSSTKRKTIQESKSDTVKESKEENEQITHLQEAEVGTVTVVAVADPAEDSPWITDPEKIKERLDSNEDVLVKVKKDDGTIDLVFGTDLDALKEQGAKIEIGAADKKEVKEPEEEPVKEPEEEPVKEELEATEDNVEKEEEEPTEPEDLEEEKPALENTELLKTTITSAKAELENGNTETALAALNQALILLNAEDALTDDVIEVPTEETPEENIEEAKEETNEEVNEVTEEEKAVVIEWQDLTPEAKEKVKQALGSIPEDDTPLFSIDKVEEGVVPDDKDDNDTTIKKLVEEEANEEVNEVTEEEKAVVIEWKDLTPEAKEKIKQILGSEPEDDMPLLSIDKETNETQGVTLKYKEENKAE